VILQHRKQEDVMLDGGRDELVELGEVPPRWSAVGLKRPEANGSDAMLGQVMKDGTGFWGELSEPVAVDADETERDAMPVELCAFVADESVWLGGGVVDLRVGWTEDDGKQGCRDGERDQYGPATFHRAECGKV
jgi:hypothetical protein